MFFAKEKEIVTDDKKIDELLSRGVKDVFVMDSLRARLKSGKQLRVKLGFDPTGAQIHLGRAVILRKLREFQQLGHKVVFIIGDYTARIGDPSDKLNKRPMLTADKIEENLKDYKTQVGKILDLKSIEFRRNSLDFKKSRNWPKVFPFNKCPIAGISRKGLKRGRKCPYASFSTRSCRDTILSRLARILRSAGLINFFIFKTDGLFKTPIAKRNKKC